MGAFDKIPAYETKLSIWRLMWWRIKSLFGKGKYVIGVDYGSGVETCVTWYIDNKGKIWVLDIKEIRLNEKQDT